MINLVIHPATKRQVDDYLMSPSHAVLLVAPAGSGKRSLAIKLAETTLKIEEDGFDRHPYSLIITSEEGKAIGIESVRQLEQFLSLKVPGNNAYDRVVIIEDAHLLSLEAQNAVLKTLEEPPEGTLMILTADYEQSLLPTILSRTQTIFINRPSQTQLRQQFKDYKDDEFERFYAISGGFPGLLKDLLDNNDHPLMLATSYARRLLAGSVHDRLLAVDEISKQRELSHNLVFILQQMAHLSLQTASKASADRWQRVLEASYQAAAALDGNAQPKLVLTNLMLSL